LKTKLSNEQNKIFSSKHSNKFHSYIKFIVNEIGRETINQGNVEKIQKRFDAAVFNPFQFDFLLKEGLIDDEKKLTEFGIDTLINYSHTTQYYL